MLLLGVGTAVWFLLGVLPNLRKDSGVYFIGILVIGVVSGLLWPTALRPGSAPLAAVLLVGPGFLLLGWTLPKGDNDGLWVLWYPALVVLMVATGIAHWLGARTRRRLLHQPPAGHI